MRWLCSDGVCSGSCREKATKAWHRQGRQEQNETRNSYCQPKVGRSAILAYQAPDSTAEPESSRMTATNTETLHACLLQVTPATQLLWCGWGGWQSGAAEGAGRVRGIVFKEGYPPAHHLLSMLCVNPDMPNLKAAVGRQGRSRKAAGPGAWPGACGPTRAARACQA